MPRKRIEPICCGRYSYSYCLFLTHYDWTNEHTNARQRHGPHCRPPPAEEVEAPDAEQIGGQLQCGGHCEGGVDAVVEVGDVADVTIENTSYQHPTRKIIQKTLVDSRFITLEL